MALSKKGLRIIQVNGEKFVWKVRRKTSHEERHDAQLGIPIQHIAGGQLLIAYVGYSRSHSHSHYRTYSIKEITPAIIENQITNAINLGWQYKAAGKPVSVVNGKLTRNTRDTRPQAELEAITSDIVVS